MTYYMNDKMINDIKCKVFLSNTANELTDISEKICIEGKNNKLLSDTIVKNACINNKLLNSISTEEGIKNGIRKKNTKHQLCWCFNLRPNKVWPYQSDDIGTWDNKIFKREWNNGY